MAEASEPVAKADPERAGTPTISRYFARRTGLVGSHHPAARGLPA